MGRRYIQRNSFFDVHLKGKTFSIKKVDADIKYKIIWHVLWAKPSINDEDMLILHDEK
jgi:hypothetical protein